MKQIIVGKHIILIDDDIHEKLKDCRFEVYPSRELNYAYVFLEERLLLHRHIMGLSKGDNKTCDHKNKNTLDNQKENLRVCSLSQNLKNQGKNLKNCTSNKPSVFKGVSWHPTHKKWFVKIRFKYQVGSWLKKKRLHLFSSDSEIECAYGYDFASKIVEPVFSYLNNVTLEEQRKSIIENIVKDKLKPYVEIH